MTLPPWPRRPAPHHRLPPARPTQLATETPVLAPRLVPRGALEAWGALVVLLATMAFVGYLLVVTIDRFIDGTIPARVAYGAIGIGAIVALVVYAMSVIAHVLPTALGIRRR